MVECQQGSAVEIECPTVCVHLDAPVDSLSRDPPFCQMPWNPRPQRDEDDAEVVERDQRPGVLPAGPLGFTVKRLR